MATYILPKRIRPWVGRCAFVLVLASLGVGLYFNLPHQALWTLDVDEQIGGFALDGSHFFTWRPSRKVGGFGPIRLRDARTGAEVDSFFPDGTHWQGPEVSSDRRYLATIAGPNEVRVIDFLERAGRSLRSDAVTGDYQLHFAPKSDMLRVRAAHAKLPDRNFLFELPSGKHFGKPDEILTVQFAENGRHFAYGRMDGIHLWDRQAQKEIAHDLGEDERLCFSPDGRRLVAYDDRGETEPFRLILWDLEQHRRVAVLPIEIPLETRYCSCRFSSNSQWFVTWHDYPTHGKILETWDSANGKRLARHELGAHRRSIERSPDSTCLALHEWGQDANGDTANVTLTLLDMPSTKVRWQRHFPRQEAKVNWMMDGGFPRPDPDEFRFSPDGSVLVVFSSFQAEWQFLDVQTGATLKTVRLLDIGASASSRAFPVLSPDGRHMLSTTRLQEAPSPFIAKWLGWAKRWLPNREQHYTLTVVHDATNGDELLRLKIDGNADSHLAPDGSLVLTDNFWSNGADMTQRRLQAWPVPAQRAWEWIVGVPVLFAAVLLLLRWAWRFTQRTRTERN